MRQGASKLQDRARSSYNVEASISLLKSFNRPPPQAMEALNKGSHSPETVLEEASTLDKNNDSAYRNTEKLACDSIASKDVQSKND